MTSAAPAVGKIVRVSGPVVAATGIAPAMYEVVLAGAERLLGEVIQLRGEQAIIQVYEDTTGIRPGEPVEATGASLSVDLGPGLLGQIYDGIQRPLPSLAQSGGDFLRRGASAPALDRQRAWTFTPCVQKGDSIVAGQPVGSVQETPAVEHRILAPPNMPPSRVAEIRAGDFRLEDTVCVAEETPSGPAAGAPTTTQIRLAQRWPVRIPRPAPGRQPARQPLLTGQRVIDTFFPIAKGGAAAIPGPFGSGKTITQQQLARWSDARIVVYIGCGERGNEMTEVLKEFPKLVDPYTGRPLMERTVLIANTSNMPVAAREASVYTGITIAEYYRDMGCHVALMADSTSRWAEAMREISSRLEEMPGEEGYPAYLASRLAQFYERAGAVKSPAGEGSITVIGAVSPPGGDFSEPVTQNTLRIVKAFFGLDARLAQRRHFPSINWLTSYTLYDANLRDWFRANVAPDFLDMRAQAMSLLQKEAELQEIVQLVGADSLPEDERLVLETTRMIRELFLRQNAYHPVDACCPLASQALLLRAILRFHAAAGAAIKRGVPLQSVLAAPSISRIARDRLEKERDTLLAQAAEEIERELNALAAPAAPGAAPAAPAERTAQ